MVLLCGLLLCVFGTVSSKPPHIVFILADDLGTVNCCCSSVFYPLFQRPAKQYFSHVASLSPNLQDFYPTRGNLLQLLAALSHGHQAVDIKKLPTSPKIGVLFFAFQ